MVLDDREGLTETDGERDCREEEDGEVLIETDLLLPLDREVEMDALGERLTLGEDKGDLEAMESTLWVGEMGGDLLDEDEWLALGDKDGLRETDTVPESDWGKTV